MMIIQFFGSCKFKSWKNGLLGGGNFLDLQYGFFFSRNPFFGLANAHPRKDSLKRNSLFGLANAHPRKDSLKRNSLFELAKNELKKKSSSSTSSWFSRSLFFVLWIHKKKKDFLRGKKKTICGVVKNRYVIIIIFKELIFWSCKFARPKDTLKNGSFVHFSFNESIFWSSKFTRPKNGFLEKNCRNKKWILLDSLQKWNFDLFCKEFSFWSLGTCKTKKWIVFF